MRGVNIADRQPKQHRHEHEPGAVARGHQERPHGEVREADLHPAGRGLVRDGQTIKAECDQDRRSRPTQRVQIDDSADDGDEADHPGDRNRVTGSNRQQGPQHSGAALVLQAQCDREEPTHRRVEAVEGAQAHQAQPGPGVGRAAVPRHPTHG